MLAAQVAELGDHVVAFAHAGRGVAQVLIRVDELASILVDEAQAFGKQHDRLVRVVHA